MNIKYEIEFFSYWHCSAGKSPYDGHKLLVVKDAQGFPYVPGRTVKGLLRENLTNLIKWKYQDEKKIYYEWLNFNFGIKDKEEGEMHVGDALLANAEMEYIASESVQHLLFSESRHRKEDSRKEYVLEVTIPCRLIGTIDVGIEGLRNEDDILEFIREGFGLIKRIGMLRNNGLGRCQIRVIK